MVRFTLVPPGNIFINEHPIALGDILKEPEHVLVVFYDLACVDLFDIINRVKHPIVISLPLFKLHNIEIDSRNEVINES